ncbi:MAG: cache domain-containing protein [Candidatus Babeliales bacterium]|nr:cache domain-containing protein [Candidatus Babeliales bacterium]
MIQSLNRKQLAWLYITTTAAIILGLGSSSYLYFKNKELNTEFKKLEHIQQNLSKDITNYLANNISNIVDIISKNQNLIIEPNAIANTHLANYADVLFILPDGKVKFSLKKEIAVDINIYENYKNTLLTTVNDQLKNSAQLAISDFDYLPNFKQPSLFIGVPLYKDNKYVGNILVKVNTNEIAEIIKTYFNKLTKNGDLLVAKKSGKNSLVIFPSKYNPDSAFTESFNLHEKNPINHALLGLESTDIIKVYDTDIINSRNILTIVPWGISVEENKADILGKYKILKNILFIIFIFTLMALFFFIYLAFNIILNLLYKYKTNIAFLAIIILLGYLFILFGFYLKKYNENKIKLTGQSFIQSKLQVEHVSSLLQQNLNDIKALNTSIALDLTTEKLTESNITEFLQNKFDKYPYIAGIYISYLPNEYKPDIKLFGQYYINKEGTVNKGQLDTVYDYSASNWFNKTIKETDKNLWFEPTLEKGITNEITIMNTMPFYGKDKQKIKGVVSILYSYSTISDIISLLGQNKLKNSLIFSNNGNLIFHPNKELISQDITFKAIIDDISPKLEIIQDKGIQGYSGYMEFTDNKTQEKKWAFYESIPTTNWTLAVFYPNDEFNIFNNQQYIYFIYFIIILSLILILIYMFLTKIYLLNRNDIKHFVIYYSLVILVGIISILFIYYNYPRSELNNNIITNRLELDQLIEKEMQRFSGENFITTKAGINLKSLNVNDGGTFLAYLWQKLNTDTQKDVNPGIEVVNLAPYDGLYYYLDEGIKNTVNNIQTTRWLCQSSAYQKTPLQSTYPFDIKLFKFVLSPVDNTKKILLIPDIKDYPGLDPESKPGFGEDIRIVEFDILKSYFSYDNEYGNQQTEIVKPKNLSLNILLKRDFVPIFITYFIPLIIILLTLFCIFTLKYIRETDEMGLIGAYSGLLFGLILIHQSFRSAITPTTISFLEYFIFLDYLFIALAYVDVFLPKEKENDKLMVFLFWPAFLTLLFIITIKIFIQ